MQRDGANESLWQDSMPAYQSKNDSFSSTFLYDVVIVGGGITGLATAFQLQKSGLTCLVLESQALCFGTTGGTTAHLNNFFDNTYAEFAQKFGGKNAGLIAGAARNALDLYKSNIADLGIDCDYVENEGYLFALDDQQANQLEKVFTASREAGVAVRWSESSSLPVPFKKCMVYEQQAQLHPVKYVYGLAKAFEKAGGVIVQHCRVSGNRKAPGEHPGGTLAVQTDRGEALTRHLIYATHVPPGINVLDFKTAPWRSYVLACELENANYPADPGYDMSDPYHYYRTHVIEGKPYLIAGGEDHATGKEPDTREPFDRLLAYVSQYFKVKNVYKKWSSQYFDPADGLAYIGHLPGEEKNVFIACGFAGNGMTYSHIAATLLTALVRGEVRDETDLFSPTRIKPGAALGNEIKAGLSVAASLIGDRFKIKKIIEDQELDRGEGRVVKNEGENLAVYHDMEGKFHSVSPTCTHMGCIVQWNQTEKSWDCPCHGARYSVDGEMITGPADKNLPVHTPVF